MRYFLSILFFNLILSQVYFSDIPENTGVSHMIVIENIIEENLSQYDYNDDISPIVREINGLTSE